MSFTYRVPFELNDDIQVGKRVSVPFGRSKFMAGIIIEIAKVPPKFYEAKYIIDIIDEEPLIDEMQLQFWAWISSYYMCSLGLVMNAGLPAGLKLEGEAKVVLNPDFDWQMSTWDDKEQLILQILEAHIELTISQISKLTSLKSVHRYIKSLYLKGALLIKEQLGSQFKSKKEQRLRIANNYRNDDALNELFNQLEKRAIKQLEAIMKFLSLTKIDGDVLIKDLLASGASRPAIKALVDKDIFIQDEIDISRINQLESHLNDIVLSEEQSSALANIRASFNENRTVLLHGITSSGKTLIYIELIKEQLAQGKQILYLVPEIALTSQLLQRLAAYFGEQMLVTHSKFSNNERVEVYYKIQSGEALLVLGTRSAIFQPFTDLGLIIIDEEHESSLKQHEPSPRFHARDSALYLAHLTNAKIILGSATPSIESYYNAKRNKFDLVSLTKRFDDAALPNINIIDMREQKKQKRSRGIFSDTLLQAMLETKEKGKQSIIFQNKKGYVPVLECTQCSWTPQCINCDISLTYYKFQDNLRCHYCGYTRPPVHKCSACGHNGLELIGYGTERIEDELNLYAPELKCQRLDYNTTKLKNSHKKIIDQFAKGEIDVLIGTQMVAKGLDFDNVSLVGIVNADHILNFPDFRAFERAFQLMTQVAGRAGRRKEIGEVYIQSSKPDHPVLQHIVNNDYTSMYEEELNEREQFNYPPLSRLIRISLKHKDPLQLHKCTQIAQQSLKEAFQNNILGPEKPYVGKIRNWYLIHFLLKMENNIKFINHSKSQLRILIDKLEQNEQFKGVRIVVDVDPI